MAARRSSSSASGTSMRNGVTAMGSALLRATARHDRVATLGDLVGDAARRRQPVLRTSQLDAPGLVVCRPLLFPVRGEHVAYAGGVVRRHVERELSGERQQLLVRDHVV